MSAGATEGRIIEQLRVSDTGLSLLHIGLPKAASTFLQTRVFPFVPGYTYVGPTSPFPLLHQVVHSVALGEDFPEEPASELLRHHGRLIVSHEGLSGGFAHPQPGRRDLRQFRTRLAARMSRLIPESVVLVITRERASWLKSAYAQYLRSGGTLKFSDFARTVEREGYLEWDDLPDAYRRQFTRVVTVPFEEIRQDVYRGVVEALAPHGFDFLGVAVRVGLVNPSNSRVRQRILRHVNKFVVSPHNPNQRRISGLSTLAGVLVR